MTSKFWRKDPTDNYSIVRDRKGRMVVKVVTPGGVVGLICADIPVATVAALKKRIQCRILTREAASGLGKSSPDIDQSDGQD